MTDANQSFDTHHIAKEQEGRMAAGASIGFNAVKPFIQFQIAMMRVFAENIDRVARNYEIMKRASKPLATSSRSKAANRDVRQRRV